MFFTQILVCIDVWLNSLAYILLLQETRYSTKSRSHDFCRVVTSWSTTRLFFHGSPRENHTGVRFTSWSSCSNIVNLINSLSLHWHKKIKTLVFFWKKKRVSNLTQKLLQKRVIFAHFYLSSKIKDIIWLKKVCFDIYYDVNLRTLFTYKVLSRM